MEVISDIVSFLKPDFYASPGLEAGGAWAIQFPAQTAVKFDTLTQGSCWICVDGDPHAYRLQEGDCFLLNSGRPFRMGSDLSLPPTAAHLLFTQGCDMLVRFQGGGACSAVGGRFTFSGSEAEVLFSGLPPLIVMPARSEEASTLYWSLQVFVKELRSGKPGSSLSLQHLAQLMLVQMLRFHLGNREATDTGWLAAVRDPQLFAALRAIHDDLARPWTVERLARAAAMSRSSFAQRFRSVMAMTPLEYLTQRRLHRAAHLLGTTQDSTLQIANETGYASESAFSTAFRRHFGQAPRSFRRHSST